MDTSINFLAFVRKWFRLLPSGIFPPVSSSWYFLELFHSIATQSQSAQFQCTDKVIPSADLRLTVGEFCFSVRVEYKICFAVDLSFIFLSSMYILRSYLYIYLFLHCCRCYSSYSLLTLVLVPDWLILTSTPLTEK